MSNGGHFDTFNMQVERTVLGLGGHGVEDGGGWLEQKFNRERKTQLNPKESEEDGHGNGPITVAGDALPAAAHRATLLGGWANSVSVYF